MNIPGYCSSCKLARRVEVTAAEIARVVTKGRGPFIGTCEECQRKEEGRR